jgi:hypothetical protein
MGWMSGSTGGERAADTYASNAQQGRQHHEKMSDIAWKRRQLADFAARNQRHKLAAFEMEKQEARRENRPPRIWSPEQVPDLELPEELVDRPPQPMDLSWLKWPAIAFGLWLPIGITSQAVGSLPGIISFPILAAVLLTEIWLVLRYLAKGNAEKLAKAEKWNPVNVSKTSAAWVKDQAAKRQVPGQPAVPGHEPPPAPEHAPHDTI